MASRRPKVVLLAGQSVRVRTEAEIRATLDADGTLDGMPFMPEMTRFCGRVFRVFRRAGRTCVENRGLRRLASCVLLDGLRCDGAFHGGCQRGCLYFWKEAWLEAVPGDPSGASGGGDAVMAPPAGGSPPVPAEATVGGPLSPWASRLRTLGEGTYFCQSSGLMQATTRLSRWDITPFFREIRTRELTLLQFLRLAAKVAGSRLRKVLGFQVVRRMAGRAGATPAVTLDLKPGDWVRVRSLNEIRATLDAGSRNRGLAFMDEMADYADTCHQVETVLDRIILEQSGRMITLENTVILKGATCRNYLCNYNCPRNNLFYWREAWLEPVAGPEPSPREFRPVRAARGMAPIK